MPLALLVLGGCGQTASHAPPEEAIPADSAPAQGRAIEDRTVWDVYQIQGARVGYGETTIRHATEDGRPVLKIEGRSHLAIRRFGERTEQEIRFASTETPEGGLLQFESRLVMGALPMITRGRVEGDQLRMTTTMRGNTTETTIPWSPDYGGFYAAELSLARRSMEPGQRRTFKALIAGFNQVGTTQLTARDIEPVALLHGTYRLLRIDAKTTFPSGQTIDSTLWTDRTGEVLKNWTDAMGLESYRVTKAEALEEPPEGQFDLGENMLVKVARPLNHPHETTRVRYRLRLEGQDPAAVLVSGPSQEVKSLDPETAELTVFCLKRNQPVFENTTRGAASSNAPGERPTADDLKPNHLIQSDDPKIQAMAAEAAGDGKDPWETAVALERHVNEQIAEKNFSRAFASAAEVAKTGEGDCTEHAVLLAALARARGIPSRVAMGLVYMNEAQAFGYHMWTEVFVDGRWIPLDATLARGGIGAAHLKLLHSNLKGVAPYTVFLPTLRVLGKLKIEIVDVETQP